MDRCADRHYHGKGDCVYESFGFDNASHISQRGATDLFTNWRKGCTEQLKIPRDYINVYRIVR